MLSVHDRVWAVFGSPTDETALRAGSVSCTFQSGGFGFAIVNLAEVQGLGFRYCVSTGNETDLDFADFARYLIDDPDTRVIAGFVEGFKDVQKFIAVAK